MLAFIARNYEWNNTHMQEVMLLVLFFGFCFVCV